MQYTFGNDESFSRLKLYAPAFQVDDQPAVDHIEEFILVIMFVPMIFALDHTDPHHGRIDLAESLVEPRDMRVRKLLLVDELQGAVQNIESRVVGEIFDVTHLF